MNTMATVGMQYCRELLAIFFYVPAFSADIMGRFFLGRVLTLSDSV
jgi:hypothetical protein